MFDFLQREERLIGSEAVEKLYNSTVTVCGLGGVGGACAEALCRAGVGRLVLIDNDCVNITNLNRQLIATRETVGMKKTEAAKKRLLDINPEIKITALDLFLTTENVPEILDEYPTDYVIDCIDNVSAKISLAVHCEKNKVPLISSMGTGNKLYPEMLRLADIYETSMCPLARVMRRELKLRGVKKLLCIYSEEKPKKLCDAEARTPASVSFVPPAAGFMLCARAVRELIGVEGKKSANRG